MRVTHLGMTATRTANPEIYVWQNVQEGKEDSSMGETFAKWDAADSLKTEEDALYKAQSEGKLPGFSIVLRIIKTLGFELMLKRRVRVEEEEPVSA